MTTTIRLLRDTDFCQAAMVCHDLFDMCEDANFASAWKGRWREKSFGMWMRNTTLVGVGVVSRDHMLRFFFVDSRYHNQGYGSTLLRHIIRHTPHLSLVPVADERVIRWYMRHGGFQISKKEGDRYLLVHHPYPTRGRCTRG